MYAKDLIPIPENLPISGKIGKRMLFQLKWQIMFLDGLLSKKGKKDPFSPQLNYIIAEISAKVWIINYIIKAEKKLQSEKIALIKYNGVPEIPAAGFAYKEKDRLKRLMRKVEYLQDKKERMTKKRKKGIKTLEYDLEILFWVINHAVFLKKMENLQL